MFEVKYIDQVLSIFDFIKVTHESSTFDFIKVTDDLSSFYLIKVTDYLSTFDTVEGKIKVIQIRVVNMNPHQIGMVEEEA